MTVYTYKAIDAAGALRAGEIDVGTRGAALDTLHRRGLVPIEVSDSSATAAAGSWWNRARNRFLFSLAAKPLGERDLLGLTHSLAALLKAGLTADRALAISSKLENRPAAGRFLDDLARAVRAGSSFTDALRTSGVALPVYYLSMVEAGELGGALPQSLARAAELLSKSVDLKGRIQSALIYPMILACAVVGTLVMLLVFVLPRFQALFAEAEAPLPWSTRAVLQLGEFATQYGWLMLGAIAAALVAVQAHLKTTAGRERFHRWLLETRLTFGLPAQLDTAPMLRTLGTLLQNGVPLPSALRVSQGTLGNRCLRAALKRVTRGVNAGKGFTSSLASAGVFPAQAVQLARVGEETGRLHELLIEAASILEAESERTLARMMALLVPLLTVFMGLIVAGLIGSVLIGLLSINDLAL